MREFSRPRQRRRTASATALRILFMTALLCAPPAAWLAWTTIVAVRQRAAVRAIQSVGGFAAYSWEWQRGEPIKNRRPPAPRWLVSRLGRDFFGHVVYVDLMDRGSDGIMVAVGRLERLEELILTGSDVTDRGLRHLQGLSRLRLLELSNTQVCDAGLSYVRDLVSLETLDLSETRITDDGLRELKRLTRLEALRLNHDDVSDSGLACLEGLVRLRILGLAFTNVSDYGLAPLKAMSQLQSVDVRSTRVTEFGAQTLRRANREMQVSFTATSLY
jgi:Leucine-rich repeat (LRR) protein